MKETGRISDKSKGISTSPDRETNFTRIKAQEKLTLDPKREHLLGGSGREETPRRPLTEGEKIVKTRGDDFKYVTDMFQDGQIGRVQYEQGMQAAQARYMESLQQQHNKASTSTPAKRKNAGK